MTYRYTELIRATYRGEAAHRHVTAISQHHRIQGSPGYRDAAAYVAAQLERENLQVVTRSYPADGRARFWTTPSFLEWSGRSGTLHLPAAEGRPAELVCDFDAIPTSLIQRSIPVDGVFEVVAPGGAGGIRAGDYAGLEVRGKVVLTDKPIAQVHAVAVAQLGAAGLLFDGMKAGGRTEFDLPDARQYTSFWWGGQTQPDAWGFVLSPVQGKAWRERLAKGETLRVAAKIEASFCEGAFEVVDAFIPGDTTEEVLLVSHLCHPKPGAHDNASGAAALLETAVTLARLIARGDLPRPRRGIRFIWPPEMTGTFAYLQERLVEDGTLHRFIAGLNLDMVGADQNQTGGIWELVSLPWAGASFADHLLSWLREPFTEGLRHRETAFSAGSDHYILSDPTVGIPAPMLIHWPDKFYHTSADTPDRVSPDSLARSGAVAAVYAYWVATAGLAEARWLAHRMTARFAADAARDAAAAVEGGSATAGSFGRRLELKAATAALALTQLARLAPAVETELGEHEEAIEAAAERERAWVARLSGNEAHAAPSPVETEAAALIPRRLAPGPIDVAMALRAEHPELMLELWLLVERIGPVYSDITPVMQYWTDGRRTVADIAELTALETGVQLGDAALSYFKLLATAGLIALERA